MNVNFMSGFRVKLVTWIPVLVVFGIIAVVLQ